MHSKERGYALRVALSVVLFSALSACPVFAQSITDGAIGGTVYDASGAVVPGATVIVHNNGTNLDQTVSSDSTGFYKAVKLTPAAYTVTVTATGFQTFRADQVIVTVGSVTNVSPHLAVGATTQTVEVTGVTPQVNTTSADFSSTLNQTAIANLPIQRARWSAFAQLTPGVVQDSNGYGLLSFRGMSTLLNNVTVDGADDNNAFWSEQRGRTRASYSETEESVQEFQVNTSNYSAEYGRAAGGVVNVVTKSGTNEIHGDVTYKNRENGWAARNPFATETISEGGSNVIVPIKPTDYWDVESGAIGGPIKKDKLFFFFAYDNFYRNFPVAAVASSPSAFITLPAASLSSGVTCTAANNKSPGKLSSTSGASTQTIGACALAGIVEEGTSNPVSYATGYSTYVTGLDSLLTNLGNGTGPRSAKQTVFFPKLDWQINQKNRASFEVNRERWTSPYGVQTNVTAAYSVGAAMGNDNEPVTWGIGRLNSFLTPTFSNEFRYQLGHDFQYESYPPMDPYEINELYKTSAGSSQYPSWATYSNPLGFATSVGITGGFTFGVPYYGLRYEYPNEHRNQFTDNMTWTRHNHTIKWGVDFNHVSDVDNYLAYQEGNYSYSNVAAYLEDLYAPAACSGLPCATNYTSYKQAFGQLAFNFNTNDYALFVQDDWKVRPRLSLSLGLRWEYTQMPAPLYPNPAVAATTTLPHPKTNFGPRLGFAYDVFGDGKTALRGGFGIYYGRILNSTLFSVLTSSGLIQNGVVAGQTTYSTNAPPAGSTGGAYMPEILSSLPTTGGTPIPAILYFNPHYKNPQVDEVDLSLEHNVGWGTVLSVAYMGSFGHFLPQVTDDNITTCGGSIACPTVGTGTSAVTDAPTITYHVASGGPLTASSFTTPFYSVRPNPNFAQMDDIFGVNSNYNALVLQATHRISHNVQFNANFTWAHALDYDEYAIGNTTVGASGGFDMYAPNNLALEYGNSDLNVPLRFVFSMVATSPWHVQNHVLGYFANGWQLSPIFAAQNGLPYSAETSGNPPGILSNGGGPNGSDGQFRVPIRNNYKIPGSQNLDLHISKTIPIKEKARLELFGEAFNLFNHFNVATVTEDAYSIQDSGQTITDTGGTSQVCGSNSTKYPGNPCLAPYSSGTFKAVTAANNTYQYWTRQIQIGARLVF